MKKAAIVISAVLGAVTLGWWSRRLVKKARATEREKRKEQSRAEWQARKKDDDKAA